MKTGKKYTIISTALCLFIFIGCDKEYLNVLPEGEITSATFWQNEEDVGLALNGIYAVLGDTYLYGQGPAFAAYTPNAYIWNSGHQLIGNGSFHPGTGGIINGRWSSGYRMISRANYFLENIEKVEDLSDGAKATYIGEAHFLRGVAYSLLAETYGGVPIITSVIGVEEARKLARASVEETWNQAISDYDIAIANLGPDAPQIGGATKGAALGMKIRAYLYQNKYEEVLTVVEQIEELSKYSLFPSYEDLFLRENENNPEVIFDVENISGPYGQGAGTGMSYLLPGFGAPSGGWAAPTQDLVDAYEMIDGSEVDPENPFGGRDPRLGFSVILPGTYIGDYLFNTEAQNHVGQPIKNYAIRKYSDILVNGEWPIIGEEDLNFIVLRYADVLLAKAEALIETNQNIDEAITLINRIRTGRTDVKITSLSKGLSQSEARKALRHERRVEFAFENIYWSDIRRWEIGPDIYPMEIRGTDGGLVEIRYPNGYQLPKYRYLPIPDSEISLNENLTQNPGW